MTGPVQVSEGAGRSRRRWVLLLAVPATVGLFAVVASPVHAVAPVIAALSVPADGTTLSVPPSEVSLTIVNDTPIAEYHVGVSDASGTPVTGGSAHVLGHRITVPVTISESGRYLITYHVRFVDGAQITGIDRFNLVGPGAPTVAATPDDVALDRSGHHRGGADPFSLFLVLVDVVLITAAGSLLLRSHGWIATMAGRLRPARVKGRR